MGGVRSAGWVAALPLALAASAAACGRDANSAGAGSGPYAAKVAEAIPKIERVTGLKFKRPPKVEGRSKEQVRSFLERKFNEELPAREIAGLERTYKRFGLVPDSLPLRAYMLNLLTEQVVGFYDPSTKVLYVVDGSPEEMVGVTVTHELVHALQDQYISLDSIQRIERDNDRQTAAQAVIEGQATYEQMQAMLGGGDVATRLPGGWDRMRQMIREAQSSMPVFANAPMLIQETLLFPYLSGAEFVRRFEARSPGAVPFGAMPISTEQVMHEQAFFGERDAPARVTLPALAGGTPVYENNLGEFETRLFLFEHLQDQAAAVRGAAGWDGDRYVLFDAAGGEGIAWLTVWDSAIDAGEFYDLMDRATTRRYRYTQPRVAAGNSRTYATAAGRTVVLTTGEVAGRPVVLYVDVPAGAPANVIDLAKVRLGP